MGEIADMRSRAFNDFLVGFNQGIGLARKRSDLFRKLAGKALGPTGPNSGKTVSNTLERRQPEAHLKCCREQQDRGENGKRDDQCLVERARFIGYFGGVTGDCNEVVTFVPKSDVRLDQPESLISGPRDIALSRAVGACGYSVILQVRQTAVP